MEDPFCGGPEVLSFFAWPNHSARLEVRKVPEEIHALLPAWPNLPSRPEVLVTKDGEPPPQEIELRGGAFCSPVLGSYLFSRFCGYLFLGYFCSTSRVRVFFFSIVFEGSLVQGRGRFALRHTPLCAMVKAPFWQRRS